MKVGEKFTVRNEDLVQGMIGRIVDAEIKDEGVVRARIISVGENGFSVLQSVPKETKG